MRIENHRLMGVPFQEAQWMGGEIAPEIVVLHDTASRLVPGAAASYLARNDAKVSVHFVVERDGQITQQVPANRAAWHAGKSTWQGRSGCNDFSLGIEMVNAGRMTWASETMARAWWGELLSISLFGIELIETSQHGHGLWMPYPEPQIGA
ncbi:N-acetylmuramoyl-L-alanine amidase, partial [Frigidibacter oleivorans]|uniref:N-acetylmuramoyl-L-alanine amidase n=1 Tax=Frigidibacter oleivorans TaxID=2487129 RepID=UPI00197AFC0C